MAWVSGGWAAAFALLLVPRVSISRSQCSQSPSLRAPAPPWQGIRRAFDLQIGLDTVVNNDRSKVFFNLDVSGSTYRCDWRAVAPTYRCDWRAVVPT